MTRIEELRTAIRDNTVPGGSAFGRAAAELIALSIEASSDRDLAAKLDELSTWLVATKPSMTSIRTVIALARQALDRTSGSPRETVAAAMWSFIDESKDSIDSLARHANAIFHDDAVVLYHSYSGSLVRVLTEAAANYSNLTVMLTESRPYRESRRIAEVLQRTGVNLIAWSDAAMAIAAESADFVMVGADAILRDGSFVNKTGSQPLALCAKDVGKPYYVVSELTKLYLGDPEMISMEQRPGAELAADWELWASGRVTVCNQFFERVRPDLVTCYLTERGQLVPSEIAALADQAPASELPMA